MESHLEVDSELESVLEEGSVREEVSGQIETDISETEYILNVDLVVANESSGDEEDLFSTSTTDVLWSDSESGIVSDQSPGF